MAFDEPIMFWGRGMASDKVMVSTDQYDAHSHGDRILLVHLGGKSGSVLVEAIH